MSDWQFLFIISYISYGIDRVHPQNYGLVNFFSVAVFLWLIACFRYFWQMKIDWDVHQSRLEMTKAQTNAFLKSVELDIAEKEKRLKE